MQDKNISYLAKVCSDIFKLIRWERRGGMERDEEDRGQQEQEKAAFLKRIGEESEWESVVQSECKQQ